MNVPIEESIELCDSYPSVVYRYFSRQYVTENQNDICLLFHSNKICVVTLAKSHIILKNNLTIRKVNFKIGDKLDRMDNKVKGKGKKGGQHVDANSILCIIECEDNSEYCVKAGVKGKLIEVNENLIENPQLLVSKPDGEGYIAVVLQKLGEKFLEKNYKNEKEYIESLD